MNYTDLLCLFLHNSHLGLNCEDNDSGSFVSVKPNPPKYSFKAIFA